MAALDIRASSEMAPKKDAGRSNGKQVPLTKGSGSRTSAVGAASTLMLMRSVNTEEVGEMERWRASGSPPGLLVANMRENTEEIRRYPLRASLSFTSLLGRGRLRRRTKLNHRKGGNARF